MTDASDIESTLSKTGYRRAKKVSLRVKFADRAAAVWIAVAGNGVIAAVAFVCVFLLWVAVPLFLPPTAKESARLNLPDPLERSRLVHLGVDEYLTSAWGITAGGSALTVDLVTGKELVQAKLGDETPSALAFAPREGRFLLGYEDGTIRLGAIRFVTRFLGSGEVSAELHALGVGERRSIEGAIVERTPEGQFRRQEVRFELGEKAPLASGSAIELCDLSVLPKGEVVAALTQDGNLVVSGVSRRTNLLTGEVKVHLRGGAVAVPGLEEHGRPFRLMLSGLGDRVYLVWEDGRLLRFDTRDLKKPTLAEEVDLVPEGRGTRVTAAAFLIGKTSLVIGDSTGRIRIWFPVKPPGAATADGTVLAPGHEFPQGPGSITSLTVSSRSRLFAAGYDNGTVRLYYATSERLCAELQPLTGARKGAGGGVGTKENALLCLAPKDNALLTLSAGELRVYRLNVPHPEITLRTIFAPVWYEGYEKPQHVWQSSSGSDDFEPKFGLYPLIFGTLKATLYAMLFGAPIAIFAALYTSEFLNRNVKARVKPVIELMASVPSVVLGFLAGLVFAPFVEKVVPQVLAGIFSVPFAFLLGAHLYQLLRGRLPAWLSSRRLLLMLLTLPLGLALAAGLGPPAEKLLFGGDIRVWLNGQTGTGTGGWVLIFLPLSALLSALFFSRWAECPGRGKPGWDSRERQATRALARFLLGSVITVLLAFGFALLLTALGFDPRGGVFGTYVQRNALVVGFVMGFAIIPIIYTVAEDAFSAVPDYLRAASLAAGATPWQTAVRIIAPTAMSGVFSALMIGVGRAVGETMIVLMAAGNTPVLDWNPFNGFRTLSANIAVELPEAVKGSTHYRMLFLAALVLFCMTFVVNTAAESVRLHFRRRAYQL